MKALPLVGIVALLAACEPVQPTQPGRSAPETTAQSTKSEGGEVVSTRQAQANFAQVIRRVEPVAEAECRARTPDLNCDFKIVVDTRANQPPNAYQTLERDGRPVIGFTVSLLRTARNTDEVAFVMGHEAAHHIERHLAKQRQSATGGAILGGILAAGLGVPTDLGTRLGGTIGARTFSKQNELEADALGTVIAKKSGFNPVRGAQFFTRIPDPGDRFLGSHPPNADRIATVRRVNASL